LCSACVEGTWENSNPAGRAGEHDELANLCAYLVSDEAAYINGACVTIDGGRWLQGAGMFSSLSRRSEAEWQEMRMRGSS
jgi:NAD(P)-dependent dehydrogenase (short-subunit alcohol dehydrogenase family)